MLRLRNMKEYGIAKFMWKIYERKDSAPIEETLDSFMKDEDIEIKNDTDIIEVCRSLGFIVLMMPLSKRHLDGVILVENQDKFIGVNQDLPVKKARFVIAHELGHYIDRCSKLKESNSDKQLFFAAKDNVYHDNNKLPTEHDMDYLAAAILVPKEQFIKELDSLEVDIKSFKNLKKEEIEKKVDRFLLTYLADRYCVETEVIIKRIAEVSYYV